PEPLVFDYSYWVRADGSKELCIVIGSRLGPGALGAMRQLDTELRARLTEPGAVVLDRSELSRLGVNRIGEYAQINSKRLRAVGLVDGLKSLTGPYIFCSLDTARDLVPLASDQATYLVARCERRDHSSAIVERLRKYPDLSAFTRDEFSQRTRVYWLVMTNA